MEIRKANKKQINESLEIAEELKKWFTKNAIKKMHRTFKKNLIVALNGKVDGFLNYRINKNSLSIIWMGIKRDVHRKGIGKRLLKELEKIAKKNKKYMIRVETLSYKEKYKPYESTRNFYLKNEFKYRFIRKPRNPRHDSVVIMEKKLKK